LHYTEATMPGEDVTTRPTIETVLERINALATLVTTLAEGQAALARELREFRHEVAKSFELLNRKLDVLAIDVLEVRARQSLLEDRVEKLEVKPS
jgi:outer membrane murein-binding lipoprotein Lpp